MCFGVRSSVACAARLVTEYVSLKMIYQRLDYSSRLRLLFVSRVRHSHNHSKLAGAITRIMTSDLLDGAQNSLARAEHFSTTLSLP